MASDGYYTEEIHGPHEYLDLGNFELASGYVLPQAKLAYKTIETGTCWGHFTMFNLREQDTAAIDAIYTEALAS